MTTERVEMAKVIAGAAWLGLMFYVFTVAMFSF